MRSLFVSPIKREEGCAGRQTTVPIFPNRPSRAFHPGEATLWHVFRLWTYKHTKRGPSGRDAPTARPQPRAAWPTRRSALPSKWKIENGEWKMPSRPQVGRGVPAEPPFLPYNRVGRGVPAPPVAGIVRADCLPLQKSGIRVKGNFTGPAGLAAGGSTRLVR